MFPQIAQREGVEEAIGKATARRSERGQSVFPFQDRSYLLMEAGAEVTNEQSLLLPSEKA
ncbi:unnamed protein product [Dovyalis caffra]|uniref:Uncharacterized protein n=1 Tax=Dovyalis caffra TaxID=77055 RepID=A0AAV1RKK7_9ROSI|nr:unnamed protein product [Dovyalis caffra]